MRIGDVVFQSYSGLHRYGKVVEVKENLKGDGWSWFKINWVNDEKYINAQQWKAEMRGEEKNHYVPQFYRADDIQSINLEQTIDTLLQLKDE